MPRMDSITRINFSVWLARRGMAAIRNDDMHALRFWNRISALNLKYIEENYS